VKGNTPVPFFPGKGLARIDPRPEKGHKRDFPWPRQRTARQLHYTSTSWDRLGQAGTTLKTQHSLSRVRTESEFVTARSGVQPLPRLLPPALTTGNRRRPEPREISAGPIRHGLTVLADTEFLGFSAPAETQLHPASMRRGTKTGNLLPLPSDTTAPPNPDVRVSRHLPKTSTRKARTERLSASIRDFRM
jgi:hypothetical protein